MPATAAAEVNHGSGTGTPPPAPAVPSHSWRLLCAVYDALRNDARAWTALLWPSRTGAEEFQGGGPQSGGSWTFINTRESPLSGLEAAAVLRGLPLLTDRDRARSILHIKRQLVQHFMTKVDEFRQRDCWPTACKARLPAGMREEQRPKPSLIEQARAYAAFMLDNVTVAAEQQALEPFELTVLSDLLGCPVHVVKVRYRTTTAPAEHNEQHKTPEDEDEDDDGGGDGDDDNDSDRRADDEQAVDIVRLRHRGRLAVEAAMRAEAASDPAGDAAERQRPRRPANYRSVVLSVRTVTPLGFHSDGRQQGDEGFVLLQRGSHFDVAAFHTLQRRGKRRIRFTYEEVRRAKQLPHDQSELFRACASKWLFSVEARDRIFRPVQLGRCVDAPWRRACLFVGCQLEGKSSLIQHLTGHGRRARYAGLPSTKSIIVHPAQLIELPSGLHLDVTAIDTVGLGDANKSADKLFHELRFTLLEQDLVLDRIYVCISYRREGRFLSWENRDMESFIRGLLRLGYSREHFCVLFTHTDTDVPEEVNDRIRNIIYKEPFMRLLDDPATGKVPDHRWHKVCGAHAGAQGETHYLGLENAVRRTVAWLVEDLIDADQPRCACSRSPWRCTSTSIMLTCTAGSKPRCGSSCWRWYWRSCCCCGISPTSSTHAMCWLKR